MYVDINKILIEKLGTADIIPVEEILRDRKLKPTGWQYRRYGNSTVGERRHTDIKATMELFLVASESAKNDSDPRFYVHEFFCNHNTVIEVYVSPTRSGACKTYTIKTYTKV